jgi:hypothetical protein
MCPVCFATAALIAGSAISTGGLTALVIKQIRAQNSAHRIPTQTEAEEDQNVQHDHRN